MNIHILYIIYLSIFYIHIALYLKGRNRARRARSTASPYQRKIKTSENPKFGSVGFVASEIIGLEIMAKLRFVRCRQHYHLHCPFFGVKHSSKNISLICLMFGLLWFRFERENCWRIKGDIEFRSVASPLQVAFRFRWRQSIRKNMMYHLSYDVSCVAIASSEIIGHEWMYTPSFAWFPSGSRRWHLPFLTQEVMMYLTSFTKFGVSSI